MTSKLKPRMFVGCSAESLQIAYAIQENLERDAEVTVWTQGILELSKFTLEALLDALDRSECGVFVLAPDDVVKMRGTEGTRARDNVVFELGLFIGRLGKERTFVVLPRGHEDFELPTDLLGLTPGTFEADRTDGNLAAALGPACNRIRSALGKLALLPQSNESAEENQNGEACEYDENDIIAIIESWMGSRPASLNGRVIHYAEVDRELHLPPGTAEQYLPQAARTWDYEVARQGKETILFREKPPPPARSTRWL
ncbi:MAG TPA: nucleotide-binding protein [Thermoguttaceae bacterium]|nr:nucleotide-binding protein [Thermoguttaceae bacterium]